MEKKDTTLRIDSHGDVMIWIVEPGAFNRTDAAAFVAWRRLCGAWSVAKKTYFHVERLLETKERTIDLISIRGQAPLDTEEGN